MPWDDAAAAAAKQDELELEFGGPAGHGPIRLGEPVVGRPARRRARDGAPRDLRCAVRGADARSAMT